MNVSVRQPPRFTTDLPSVVYARPDEPVVLPCQAEGSPPPSYQWLFSGHEALWIQPQRPRTTVEHPWTLMTVANLTHSRWSNEQEVMKTGDENLLWHLGTVGKSPDLRAGTYQCIAFNRFGRVISNPVDVQIARLGTFFDLREKHIQLRPYETVRLNCSVSPSIPKAMVRWMTRSEDGSVNFIKENRSVATDNDGNLYITHTHISPSEASFTNVTYLCAVNNPILRTIRTGPDMHVHFSQFKNWMQPPTTIGQLEQRPHILFNSKAKQIAMVNRSLSIKCLLTGNPSPHIVWQWSNRSSSESSLLPTSIQQHDRVEQTHFWDVDTVSIVLMVKLKNRSTPGDERL
ncbi:hypothetical protein EG68_00280 [Paragonimus skrjabini miyazakii]|uniref:Ig-like domain-containing protein n=1 Tax=Paragonimus skrjabini miyazakii TaxID=59628 RepID=A0A8S9Z4I6_9TREM|nr:hypothetical protein EG68_00280 [Paragonimus skrjabini miyazakii]